MLWNFVLGLYAMELCPGTICYGTLFIVAYICYGTICCPVMVLCCEDLWLWIKAITILYIKLFNCVLKFEIIKKKLCRLGTDGKTATCR